MTARLVSCPITRWTSSLMQRALRLRAHSSGRRPGWWSCTGSARRVCADVYDLLVYADIARWEIRLRLRADISNWMAGNTGVDQLRKFKRGYFFEWRMVFDPGFCIVPTSDPLDSSMGKGPSVHSQSSARSTSSVRRFKAPPARDGISCTPSLWTRAASVIARQCLSATCCSGPGACTWWHRVVLADGG